MVCNKCGKEINDNSRFCSNCGNKIEVSRTCAKCGQKVNNGNFCSNCGTKYIEPGLVSQDESRNKILSNKMVVGAIAVIAFIVIAGILGSIGNKKDKKYNAPKEEVQNFDENSSNKIGATTQSSDENAYVEADEERNENNNYLGGQTFGPCDSIINSRIYECETQIGDMLFKLNNTMTWSDVKNIVESSSLPIMCVETVTEKNRKIVLKDTNEEVIHMSWSPYVFDEKNGSVTKIDDEDMFVLSEIGGSAYISEDRTVEGYAPMGINNTTSHFAYGSSEKNKQVVELNITDILEQLKQDGYIEFEEKKWYDMLAHGDEKMDYVDHRGFYKVDDTTIGITTIVGVSQEFIEDKIYPYKCNIIYKQQSYDIDEFTGKIIDAGKIYDSCGVDMHMQRIEFFDNLYGNNTNNSEPDDAIDERNGDFVCDIGDIYLDAISSNKYFVEQIPAEIKAEEIDEEEIVKGYLDKKLCFTYSIWGAGYIYVDEIFKEVPVCGVVVGMTDTDVQNELTQRGFERINKSRYQKYDSEDHMSYYEIKFDYSNNTIQTISLGHYVEGAD